MCCSASRLVAVQAGRPVRPGALHLRRAVGARPVGLPRRRPGRRAGGRAGRRSPPSRTTTSAQRALVDSVPEETLRLSPDEVRAAGRYRRRLGGGARHVVDAIGAIDRLEIEAGGFTFTGRACGPHDGRKILLLHGFPQTSWAWRDELWALGRAGYRAVAPDQRGYCTGARPAEVGDYATEHLLDDVARPGRLHGHGDVRPRGPRLGRHAGLDRGRHAIPAASAPSASCRRRTRSRCRTRCAARTRPRPPTARPWMPSARPRSPSACCSAPTAGAGAWPRSWRRRVSTTRTPRCMSPR